MFGFWAGRISATRRLPPSERVKAVEIEKDISASRLWKKGTTRWQISDPVVIQTFVWPTSHKNGSDEQSRPTRVFEGGIREYLPKGRVLGREPRGRRGRAPDVDGVPIVAVVGARARVLLHEHRHRPVPFEIARGLIERVEEQIEAERRSRVVGGRLNVEWPQGLRRRVSSIAPGVPRQVGSARRLQPDPRGAHPERPRYVAGDLHARSIRGGGVHSGGRAKRFEDFSLGPLDGGGVGNDGACAMRGGRIEPTRDACDANRFVPNHSGDAPSGKWCVHVRCASGK